VTQGVERSGQGAAVEDAAAAARSRASLAALQSGRAATLRARHGHGSEWSALWRGVGPLGRRFPKTPPVHAHGPDLPRPGFAACCRVRRGAGSWASLDRAPDRTGCYATGRGMVTGIGWARCGAVCALGASLPKLRSYARPGFAAPRIAAACCRVRCGAGSWLPGRPGTECRSHPSIATLPRPCPTHCATAVAPAHPSQLAGRSPGENAMADSCRFHRQICCENTTIEFPHTTAAEDDISKGQRDPTPHHGKDSSRGHALERAAHGRLCRREHLTSPPGYGKRPTRGRTGSRPSRSAMIRNSLRKSWISWGSAWVFSSTKRTVCPQLLTPSVDLLCAHLQLLHSTLPSAFRQHIRSADKCCRWAAESAEIR
jgi:hypothetical protein